MSAPLLPPRALTVAALMANHLALMAEAPGGPTRDQVHLGRELAEVWESLVAPAEVPDEHHHAR